MTDTTANALAAKLDLRADWVANKPARRIVEAAGHPGYGEKHAANALKRVLAGESLHSALR